MGVCSLSWSAPESYWLQASQCLLHWGFLFSLEGIYFLLSASPLSVSGQSVELCVGDDLPQGEDFQEVAPSVLIQLLQELPFQCKSPVVTLAQYHEGNLAVRRFSNYYRLVH